VSPARSSAVARLCRLALKELRETLRDRRTIITLVLMPVLVYPLLGVTFQKFFLAQFAVQEAQEYMVAFESEATAMEFRDLLSQGNQLLGREIQPGSPLPVQPGEPLQPQLKFVVPTNNTAVPLETAISSGLADLGVRLLPSDGLSQQNVEFLLQEGSILGSEARDFIEARLRAVNEAFVADVLRQQATPVALPYAWAARWLEGGDGSNFSLATLVPLVLTLMTVTGAVYPAIDLTAGERERGTLEALIAAPISRREVLVAKYVAVVCVALLTAVMNVLAMIATAYGTGLEKTLFGSAGVSLLLIAQIFTLLGVFAGFFAAVILAITSIARSFKEAQAYLIPVMLLAMGPGVLTLLPGLELTPALALTPLVNIVILTRDLLDGSARGSLALMALGSSVGYAGIALTIAARIFGTDAVLYGSAGTWGELFRRPDRVAAAPSVSQGLIALGVLFPAYILLGSLPGRWTDLSLSGRLGLSALLTILLFAVWPLVLSLWIRLDLRSGLGLNPASLWAFAGALLAGLSLWPFAYELEVFTIAPERLKIMVDLFREFEAELNAVPIVWKLTALAVVPAVCEELFFRGFLFRAFRTTLSPWGTILLTATLFGLFHVLVRDALLFERFIPTALMGVVLGWVAHRTGSTLPGMLLHVTHNGGLLLLPLWGHLLGLPDDPIARTHLPAYVLGIAAMVAVGGLALLRFPRRAGASAAE